MATAEAKIIVNVHVENASAKYAELADQCVNKGIESMTVDHEVANIYLNAAKIYAALAALQNTTDVSVE